METRVNVPLSQLPAILDEVKRKTGFQNLTFDRSLRNISVYLWAQAKKNFDTSSNPDGVPWPPRKRQRRRKRDRRARGGTGQKLLRDRGILMASMSAAGAGSIREIGKTFLEQGTNVSYGIFHQEGTRHLPIRAFAGVSEPMEDKIDLFILDDLERQVAGA